jgi:hypothetical protein
MPYHIQFYSLLILFALLWAGYGYYLLRVAYLQRKLKWDFNRFTRMKIKWDAATWIALLWVVFTALLWWANR